jgi:hypothetical protein
MLLPLGQKLRLLLGLGVKSNVTFDMKNFTPPLNLAGNINITCCPDLEWNFICDIRVELNIAHCLIDSFTNPLFSERKLR